MTTMKVAAAQCSADLGNVKSNLDKVLGLIDSVAEADLIVFPECILSGYMFNSAKQGFAASLQIDGPEIARVVTACRRNGRHVVVGFLEAAGNRMYNTAALIGPDGICGSYRKEHVPFIGVDRFVNRGENASLSVFNTRIGRIGVAICYDIRFPESARCLALAGCDVIAQPSVWPSTVHIIADHMVRVRAAENRVFIVACTRGDDENGVVFMGKSQIVDPLGEVLAVAQTGQAVIQAELNLDLAREKKLIFIPGAYQISLFEDRRPESYSRITQHD